MDIRNLMIEKKYKYNTNRQSVIANTNRKKVKHKNTENISHKIIHSYCITSLEDDEEDEDEDEDEDEEEDDDE